MEPELKVGVRRSTNWRWEVQRKNEAQTGGEVARGDGSQIEGGVEMEHELKVGVKMGDEAQSEGEGFK